MRHSATLLAIAILFAPLTPCDAAGEEPLGVGFAEVDITPPLEGNRPVWIAGYGQNRRATGVHDPIMARAVVLHHGDQRIALASVDLVGLQYPDVLRIRARLANFDYVMVASTHNHEGPDVIGIWGPSPIQSGVDPDYMQRVVDGVVEAIETAAESTAETVAYYGAVDDENLLHDSRRPIVYDATLRVLRFMPINGDKPLGLLVQWNSHPESMGSRNQLLTADFPSATVAALEQRYDCPAVYFTGTVGGLLAPPDNRLSNAEGKLLSEGDFEFMQVYGEAVAALAARAIDAAEPIRLTPWSISARPIAIPLANPAYQAARMIGVLKREARVWTGDFEQLGDPVTTVTADQPLGIVTETAYLRLGELHVACIPGEIYPELVYGAYQDPVDPAADFPEAPLEKPVMQLLPGDKTMLFGLANDEVGYIIPKRQWDHAPPFAYGREKSQYGEVNSCGPETAPILMQAFENRVKEVRP